MTEIVYSREARPLERGQVRRNPRFFVELVDGATRVLLDGPWPEIEAAYVAADVPVSRIDQMAAEAPVDEMPAHEPGAVEIPEGWSDLSWNELRVLAAAISAAPVINKQQAVEVVEAEIQRRG